MSTRSDPGSAEYDFERSAVAQFEEQVSRHASRVAIRVGEDALSYEALDRAANRLAHAVLAKLDSGEEPVALLFGKSVAQVVAVVAALKAGKVVLLLESADPAARLSHIVSDAQARLLVTDREHLPVAEAMAGDGAALLNVQDIDPSTPDSPPGLDISPDALACLLYTSGSTGRPKGIMQTHRYLLHANMRYASALGIRPADRIFRPSSFTFAGGFRALMGALLNGATKVSTSATLPDRLAEFLRREEISVMHCPPSTLRSFIDELGDNFELPALRALYVGGDKLFWADVKRLRRVLPGERLFIHSLAITETGPASPALYP